MNPWKCAVVVFDVDDTLYLERDYVRSGFSAVGAWVENRFGLEGFGDVAWRLFEAGRRGDTFNVAFDEVGVPTNTGVIGDAVGVYRGHEPAIDLLDDSRAVLEALVGIVPLGVVTDGPANSQHAKVRALGLPDLIDEIVVTADLGPGLSKPNPAAFRRIEARLGATGERCVYIGDNPHKDFAGPASLGWRTARIRRPGGLHVEAPSGDDVQKELTDLLPVLDFV